MPYFGLGQFVYDQTVEGESSKFRFYDPQDASNTATATVSAKEVKDKYGDRKVDVDGREVSELAYSKVAKELNDKRDKRIREEQVKALDDQQASDARAREAAVDFIANAQDATVEPVKEEKDGTRVYNTKGAAEPVRTDADNSSSDKKGK